MTVYNARQSEAVAELDAGWAEPRQRLNVTTIEDDAAFEAMRDEWDHLLSVTENGSVFQSWEWAFSWWQTFGSGKQLSIIAVRDDQSNLVALWPLYRRPASYLGLRLRELRLLGTGQEVSPDYMGCLASPGRAEAAVPALLDWLEANRREWDLLRLNEVRAGLGWVEQLVGDSHARRWPARVVPRARCFYVELPDSWDRYCKLLASKVRRTYRRRLRNMEMFSPRYFRWEDGGRLSEALNKLGELHRLRLADVGEQCGFSTPGYVRFHELLAPRLLERGWLGLHCLSVNDEIISMLYTFEYGGAVYVYQGGLDPTWSDYSVGTVLRCRVVQDAIARGMRELDFLKGEHSYKIECTNGVRRTINLTVNNSTVGGWAELLLRSGREWSKRAARRVLLGRALASARKARAALRSALGRKLGHFLLIRGTTPDRAAASGSDRAAPQRASVGERG